jgi:integrase
MATIFIQNRKNTKGNSYGVYFKDPNTGKLKYYKTYRQKKEANKVANDLRGLIDSGKIPEGRIKLNFLTFSEVAESLRDEWKKRLMRKDISAVTFREYNIKLNVVERVFGKKILCQIPREDIEEYRDSEIEKNSVISANRYLTIIKFVFKHGLQLKTVIDNPSDEIPLLSEKAHQRKEFLKPEKLNKLIQATQQTRAKHYLPAIIFLGAEHGASKQEILDLRWPKIDFDWDEKGIITLFRTKNKKERTEFLMPRTKQALLNWKTHLEKKRKKQGVNKLKSDYVFCRIDGTQFKEFRKSWWKALEIAGIKNFHFHDLRHTFCSNLILSGASLKDAKEMIGHADIKMTDRYSHLTLLHMNEQQIKLADYYSK